MFDQYFEVFLADTDEGKEKHYNIRYQVYCEEMGFEDKEQFPMEQESDHWDDNSVHFLVRLKHTKEWVGAMRLIPHNGNALPFEDICAIEEPANPEYNPVELSRLCLVKEIRKPNLDNSYGIPDVLPENQDSIDDDTVKLFFSHNEVKKRIIWGLFRAAVLYSAEAKIKKWYFLTSKALARIITREGFEMLNIGEPCEHKGKRYPYKMDVKSIFSSDFWDDYKVGYRNYSELQELSYDQAASA